MHRSLVGSLFLALFAISGGQRVAVAQRLVLSIRPEDLEEALRLAPDDKTAIRLLHLYVLQNRAGWGNGPRIGIFSTPFSRVVRAALAARKQGKTFTAADVSADLSAPELHVIATSQKAASDDTVVNVFSVALAPHGSKDPAEVLQPLRTTELTSEYQAQYGTAFATAGVVAIFPLSGLPANS